MAVPDGENATPKLPIVGKVDGSAYFVPNPAAQGYTEIYGDTPCTMAMSPPLGENATPYPLPVGKVVGLAYFVPNPTPLHG